MAQGEAFPNASFDIKSSFSSKIDLPDNAVGGNASPLPIKVPQTLLGRTANSLARTPFSTL
jgi:hypothetical protein